MRVRLAGTASIIGQVKGGVQDDQRGAGGGGQRQHGDRGQQRGPRAGGGSGGGRQWRSLQQRGDRGGEARPAGALRGQTAAAGRGELVVTAAAPVNDRPGAGDEADQRGPA